jgi:hydrogenase nickel incorporation protein HypA/HybF
MSLMNNLMSQIQTIAKKEDASRVTGVKVRLGALSHMSPGHFREHFVIAADGTIAAGAELQIECCEDRQAAHAADIVLDSIEVEKR